MSVGNYIPDGFRRQWGRINGRFEGVDLEGVLLISPVVLFFVFVSLVPIVYGIWLSFQTGTGAVDLEWTGLANYLTVIQTEAFWASAVKGVYFAAYTVFLQLVLGVGIALALNQSMKFGNLIRAFVFLPYMIPTIAVAAIFKWILQNEVGVVNWILMEVGLISDQLTFFSVDLAMHSVVWASTWKWTVFVILLVLARLQSIDRTLYEAARTNGAGVWRQFVDVTWPQIRTIVALVVLLRAIWQFSKFEMIFLLTQGGPFKETTTMVIYAYDLAFSELQFGRASAVTTMIFLLLLAFGALYFLIFNPEEEVEVAQ